jgi:hypothetical protein
MTEIRRWSRKKLILFYASFAVLVTLFVGLFEDFLMPVVFGSDLLSALLVAALLITGVVLAIRAYRRGVRS